METIVGNHYKKYDQWWETMEKNIENQNMIPIASHQSPPGGPTSEFWYGAYAAAECPSELACFVGRSVAREGGNGMEHARRDMNTYEKPGDANIINENRPLSS